MTGRAQTNVRSFNGIALRRFRLNMELVFQRFLGLHVAQLYSLAETQQLHPSLHIGAQIRGRYWSANWLTNSALFARHLFATPSGYMGQV
jgi:hypothetical protein